MRAALFYMHMNFEMLVRIIISENIKLYSDKIIMKDVI
jgi:hypothetical protein